MKRTSYLIVFVIMTWTSQTVFSQELAVRRVAMRDTEKFNIALDSEIAVESIKTHLNIPKDYELRNRIVSSLTNQTREIDKLGFVHERYTQYYKGFRIEHSDIRVQNYNDKLLNKLIKKQT